MALERAALEDDGRYCWTYVDEAMLRACDADGEDTEEIVQHLRAVEGVEAAALFKDYEGAVRVSLRSSGQHQRAGRGRDARRRRALHGVRPHLSTAICPGRSKACTRHCTPKACSALRYPRERLMLGFVNLFKPAGPTSTQFGARLRRHLSRSRRAKLAVGHLGTLDPQAAGVLADRARERDAAAAADRRPAQGATSARSCSDARPTPATRPARRCDGARSGRHRRAADARAAARSSGAVAQMPPMFSARAIATGGGSTSSRAPARRSSGAKRTDHDLRAERARARRRGRAAARRVQRGHVRAHAVRRSRRRVRHRRPHGRAAARSVGAVRALREPHARRGRARSGRRAGAARTRDPDSDGRARRTRARPTFAPAGSCRSTQPPADKHVFVRDSARVLVGVGETVGALLAPRKVFL